MVVAYGTKLHINVAEYSTLYMCVNFGSPVVNSYILTYASLGINGDHFVIQDGGQVPCR